MKKITMYETEDGQFFKLEADAKIHESKKPVMKLILTYENDPEILSTFEDVLFKKDNDGVTLLERLWALIGNTLKSTDTAA